MRRPEALELNPKERGNGMEAIYGGVLDIRLRAEELLEHIIEQHPDLIEVGPNGRTPAQRIRQNLDQSRGKPNLRLVS